MQHPGRETQNTYLHHHRRQILRKSLYLVFRFLLSGDGACFEGLYHYQPGAAQHIRKHAPQDEALHRIADELQAIQQRNLWQLQADIQHQGRYYHEYSMHITVERDSPPVRKPPMTQTVSWVTRYAIWPAGYISNLKRNTTG